MNKTDSSNTNNATSQPTRSQLTTPFYKNGLNFECQRCSFCCGHSPGFVYLSKRDLLALCEFFKMTIKDFVAKYCRWANYYGGTTVLSLLEKKNYDCILWDSGCTAYQARPVQCSTYPFWEWMLEEKSVWDDCAKDCPGMNCGHHWTFEEIEENRRKYVANIPLKKEEVEQLIKAEEVK